MRKEGKLLTNGEIYKHLWEEEEQPSSNVVDALIRLLRSKIEEQGEAPLIKTV